jgi:hypothetical protein
MTISSRSALVATIAAVAAASPGTALAMPVDGGSHVSAIQDLRSADARPSTAPTSMPTWPKHAVAIASSRPLPESGGGGEPWIAIGAGLAGAGLIAGGFAVAERRRLPRRRVAV